MIIIFIIKLLAQELQKQFTCLGENTENTYLRSTNRK